MSEGALRLASSQGAKKSNLAFALGCLPSERRKDALLFYDFCRTVDDVADDPKRPALEKRKLLDRWKETDSSEFPSALTDLVRRRSIDQELLKEIVRGVEMDIEPRRYETHEELRGYCWRVACAVGLVSIEIFGCQDPGSKVYAEHLGQALQLTNILRDVGEDAALGRIYLPQEDLRRFGVSPENLLAGHPDGDFSGLMRFFAGRAHADFRLARETYPAADAGALRPAQIMQASYERILQGMERDGFRVFSRRYRLTRPDKLLLLGRVLLSRFGLYP